MGIPCPAPPALLVVAVMTAPSVAVAEVRSALVRQWGDLVGESDPYEFDAFTQYYAREMGYGLTKRLVSFREPILADALPEAKLVSNQLEVHWADATGARRVNIDPGYLTPDAFVLASTKPAGHRIYLRDGIYAELTLRYERGAYISVPWTYPDFQQPMVREFLTQLHPATLALAHEAKAEGINKKAGAIDR